ncbi:MAG: ABC transporter [Candidatus Omnitrophica bacterium CG11_big_fil_rev_8_21_14_0_20_64_10]|nr:MAG: ABC transporter [Candidatus Omnitrophica bacterium CG11_big_fil_rev_8_21_14_0_20_64_10]
MGLKSGRRGPLDPAAIGMIFRREMIRLTRDPSRLAGSLGRPLLWFLVLGLGMGSAFSGFQGVPYIRYLLPGIVGMNLLFASFLSAISVIWDREFGFLKEMLVAPIPRSSIVLGKTIAGAAVACLQGCVVIAFAPLMKIPLSPERLLLILPAMFLVAFSMTALGLLIASRMTSFEGFGTLINFVIMPMFFLSGAVFPMDQVPPFLKGLGAINPMSYGVDLLRGVFEGTTLTAGWRSAAVLAAFSFVAVAAADWAFRKRS